LPEWSDLLIPEKDDYIWYTQENGNRMIMVKKKQKPKNKTTDTGGLLSGIVPRLFGKGNRQKGMSIVRDD